VPSKTIRPTFRVLAAIGAVALLSLHAEISHAAESAGSAIPPQTAPPAGQYQLDKSHASLQLRVNHRGFSTYTTRFSRFDAELTFDPHAIAASKVVATIDASSFEMDSAPAVCLDVMKGPKMLDTVKFPTIVFRSEKVRVTRAKAMEISGTLDLHGVSRPVVLTGMFNGGNAGTPNTDPRARVGFSAHGTFKRSDFGIAYALPPPGTTMGVGDLIDISIEAEFTGPPLAGTAGESR
jgi:polyisoprenoid-binding protein YceI